MPQTFKSPEAEIEEVLTGAVIEGVRRVGKTIVGYGGGAKCRSPLARNDNGKEGAEGGVSGASGDDGAAAGGGEGCAAAGAYACGAVAGGWAGGAVCRSAAVWAVECGCREAGEAYAGPGVEPTTISVEDFSKALLKGRKLAIKAALLNLS